MQDNIFIQIFTNQPLVSAFLSWIIAQTIKLLTEIAKRKDKIDFRRFLSAGGFPSSHSAAVVALTASVGLNLGFDSGIFAISMVFSGIVLFDAAVIRKAAGEQAEVLNKIIEDLYKGIGIRKERLKEFLGHTSVEVFCGIILGLAVSIASFYWMP